MPVYSNPKTEYEDARKQLVKALADKRKLDLELAELERSIYTYEGAYLADTQNSGGNIMLGFENFLKPSHASKKRALDVGDGDRLFSQSSGTYRKALQEEKEKDMHHDDESDPDQAHGGGGGVGRGKRGPYMTGGSSKHVGGSGGGGKAEGTSRKRKADSVLEESSTHTPLERRRKRTRTGE